MNTKKIKKSWEAPKITELNIKETKTGFLGIFPELPYIGGGNQNVS